MSHLTPESHAGNAISGKFLTEYFAPLKLSARTSTQRYANRTYYVTNGSYYGAIARCFPDTPGLSELIERDIRIVKNGVERRRRSGQSDSQGGTVSDFGKLLEVINRLPDSKQPKQQLVDLVNEDFQFFADTRDNPRRRGHWKGHFALRIIRHLGLYNERFLQEKDFLKAITNIDMKIVLAGGEMELQETVKGPDSKD